MYQMDEAEIEAIRRVIAAGRLFRYQPEGQSECDAFERAFAEILGASNALLVTSGTNALWASLVASGIGPGDEVLVPAYTFAATPAAVRLAGATPVVVNIDRNLGMSVEDARLRCTGRTRALIPVHMDGLSADLRGLREVAREKGLKLIEDCAQAIGGSYQGGRLGTFGDCGAFSLNENKIISCGEGGIVVTSDPDAWERLYCMQDLSARFNPVKKAVFRKPLELLGASMRVSEIQGAIMRVQLGRLEAILAGLRARKRILLEHLRELSGVSVVRGGCEAGDCGSSLHLGFEDPGRMAECARRLNAAGIAAHPPASRPAHVAWKWTGVLDTAADPAARLDWFPSVEILSRVLKHDVNLGLTLDETHARGRQLRNLLA